MGQWFLRIRIRNRELTNWSDPPDAFSSVQTYTRGLRYTPSGSYEKTVNHRGVGTLTVWRPVKTTRS